MTNLSTSPPRVVSRRPEAVARQWLTTGSAVILSVLVLWWLVDEAINKPRLFFSDVVNGLEFGMLYALIALGYTMVYGIIELINFAHGDLFMLSTLFSGFIFASIFGVVTSSVSISGWLILVVAIILSMAFGGGINMAIEFVAYRRLRHAPKLAPLITAVGMSFVLQFVGLAWNGSQPKSNWASVLPNGFWTVAGVSIPQKLAVVAAVVIPVLGLLSWLVTATRFGKAMRAVAQDQDAARLMGINVDRIISLTFLLGGALAGVAGVIWQQVQGTTSYNLGFQLGLFAFVAAVLGGIGNLTGAVLGGLLIGLIQQVNNGVLLGSQWSDSVIFALLIALMVFRPHGLLGQSLGEKV